MNYLYIDDIRFPKTEKDWHIVRNYNSAISFMEQFGCPTKEVSFDHDLGDADSKTGYDIAKWMIEKDLDMNGTFIPNTLSINVHSANSVGAKNIEALFQSYFKSKKS